MRNPDSRLTRFRRELASRIHPRPDIGEAWCLDCALNDGRSLVLPADSTFGHMDQHKAAGIGGGTGVTMETRWPVTEPAVQEDNS